MEGKLLFILCAVFSFAVTVFPHELPFHGGFPPEGDGYIPSILCSKLELEMGTSFANG